MDRSERLKLLFDHDEPLLQIDTGLRTLSVSITINPASDTAQSIPDNRKPETVSSRPDHAPEKLSQTKGSLEDAGEQPSDQIDQIHETSRDGYFCPLLAVSRFPYKLIRGDLSLSQQVASRYFDGGKFWKRSWDVYYINVPPSLGSRPLLVVPASQVRPFLQEINRDLNCNLSLPKESELGYILNFQNSHEELPQPVFLGQCTSRETKDHLEANIAPQPYQIPSEMDEKLLVFEQMIENAVNASKSKGKSKAAKARRQQMRIQNERETVQCLKRMNCYLGLRSHSSLDSPEIIDEKSWEEKRNEKQAINEENLDQTNDNGVPLPVEMNNPAPHPFWKEPIFISVDVECNERCHSQLTEVGISTLDSLDLVDIPPRDNGINWTSRIHSRHLRVEEYGHIVNREFIAGCPGNFQFGESEWVSIAELANVVQASFHPPYSQLEDLSYEEGTHGVQVIDIPEYKHKQRNLVLVGHNTSMDIKYLRDLGIKFLDDRTKGFMETIDTAELFRVSRHEETQRSLGNILVGLGITGWYLHNAGNDARYTMEAMVRMACNDSSSPGVSDV